MGDHSWLSCRMDDSSWVWLKPVPGEALFRHPTRSRAGQAPSLRGSQLNSGADRSSAAPSPELVGTPPPLEEALTCQWCPGRLQGCSPCGSSRAAQCWRFRCAYPSSPSRRKPPAIRVSSRSGCPASITIIPLGSEAGPERRLARRPAFKSISVVRLRADPGWQLPVHEARGP